MKGKPWTKAQKKKGQVYLGAHMGTVRSEAGVGGEADHGGHWSQELDCCQVKAFKVCEYWENFQAYWVVF